MNCEFSNLNSASYCSNCGQEFQTDDSVKGFLMHFLSDYFTFDSKIFKSYFPLLFKPGFLTIEYLEGKRAKYIPPLRMYIFISIIFFIALSLGNQPTSSYDDINFMNYFWDNYFTNMLPKMFFFLLPFFAILLRLFYRKSSSKFIVDFVFSVHFHSFLFASFLIYLALSFVFIRLHLPLVNQYLILVITCYIFYYLWRALYEVYGQGKGLTFFKLLGIVILYIITLSVASLGVLYLMTR